MNTPDILHGTCESCPKEDTDLKRYGSILMCQECYDNKMKIALDHQSPEKQEQRLINHKNIEDVHLMHINQENAALRIQTDIFNARISSINELKIAIDSDSEVVNKNYKLAQVLNERFQHLSGLLFDKRKEIVEMESEQRAIQTYYNELNKKLRAEERAKIALADSEYKPFSIVEKIKAPVKPKKYDKTSIKVAAQKSGWPEQVIQMTCVARDITPEAAVMILNEARDKSKQ